MIDPIELLARDDKWYLGCGDGILWAPVAPVWLDAPGFWDPALVYDHELAPLFTLAVLDADGRELELRAQSRRWTPAELTVEYRLSNGMTATEVRSVHPGGVLASEWRFQAMRETRLHLVAWSAQPGPVVSGAVEWSGGSLAFTRSIGDALRVRCELGCLGGGTTWGAARSDGDVAAPRWELTPFVEQWRPEGLPRVAAAADGDGVLFAAVHRAMVVGADGASATFALRLTAAGESASRGAAGAPGNGRPGTLGGASRRRWQELLARAPGFRCSDPYLETYYWYRWYGLWLNAVSPGAGNYAHPATCEGIGPLHRATALGAPCHARELRWLDDPVYARGALRTLLDRQRADGSLPGWVGVADDGGEGGGAGDWGAALLALDACAPDDDLVRELYPRLARHADWLVAHRDRAGTGLFDAGARGRLKGVQATVYAYTLLRALERLSARAGDAARTAEWRRAAERTMIAVRSTMWDAEAGIFSDVDAASKRRTGHPSAASFFPYATDLATAEHLAGLERTLLDPARFWTDFPVPSLPLGDPRFNARGEIEGRRRAAPFNGRVWPHANSHLVESLARTAAAHAPHLRTAAAQLLHRFVRMMFHDGELHRANCHEHYNPITGHASRHRLLDDVQQSWVVDLIVQYVLGVRPHDGGITIDPFPFDLELAELTGLRVRGHELDVRVEGERVRVTVDGREREGLLGVPIEVGG
ncbi:MAG TPA: trehalase family glycosidase [Gemmatimonadaceae bacterium]